MVNVTTPESKRENKYGKLPDRIVNKLEQYENEYFREDKPVPFCGMLVYPAKVRDFEAFSACTGCLTLDKNETIDGLRKTHLDFLAMKIQDEKEGPFWSYKFSKLMEIIFHIDNGLKCKKCGHVIKYEDKEMLDYIDQLNKFKEKATQQKVEDIMSEQEEIVFPKIVCPECQGEELIEMIKIIPDPETKKNKFLINEHEISKEDFDLLRQLVMFQNFPDYVDDSWVDPLLKKDREEKLRLERMKNDVHATIEKKVICLSITTNYKFDEIYDMSIRKFTMALATVDDLINYKIMKQAVMGGFVSLPKGKSIEHWIYKPEKDMYGDSYKDADQVKSEVSNV